MKIIVTGSLGNIGRPLIEQLVALGHQVNVITSSSASAAEVHRLGAVPQVGSLEEETFVARAFQGSQAVYLMVPPNFQVPDYNAFTLTLQRNYAKALAKAGIQYVVNLSSVGSALAGQPPLEHYQNLETFLNDLAAVNVLHLRPGGFYSNFYGSMDMIRHMGIIGNNFPGNMPLAMSDPQDIAEAAVAALHTLSFKEKSHQYIVSDKKTGDEIAKMLGDTVGIPDLKWVEFSDEQLLQALMKNGFSKGAAQHYIVDMGIAIRQGLLEQHYREQAGPFFGRRRFETFATSFGHVYASVAPAG